MEYIMFEIDGLPYRTNADASVVEACGMRDDLSHNFDNWFPTGSIAAFIAAKKAAAKGD